MRFVTTQDLHARTADVLRQVREGEIVTITLDGSAVAEIRPVRSVRPSFLSEDDLLALVQRNQADPGLTLDLQCLAGDTTDDLADLEMRGDSSAPACSSFDAPAEPRAATGRRWVSGPALDAVFAGPAPRRLSADLGRLGS